MMFIAIFVLASDFQVLLQLLIFLPIFYGIFSVLGYKKEDKAAFPAIMVVSLIVVSQIAQATTPISHAMTLIGMSTYNNYTGEVMDLHSMWVSAYRLVLLSLFYGSWLLNMYLKWMSADWQILIMMH